MASLTVALTLLLALLTSSVEHGTFALADGHARIAAQMHVTGNGTNDLDIVQFARGSTVPIVRYDLDATKLIHLVIVRDDFGSFAHLHPTFTPNGHFHLRVALASGHRYYAYVDTQPHGFGQQVFRFELKAGAPPLHLDTAVARSLPYTYAGPYGVRVGTTHLAAGTAHEVPVTITRDGALASDLHPYLGAAAHCVFINTSSLTYVHVHPTPGTSGSAMHATSGMPMAGMAHALAPNARPDGRLTLHVPALRAGTYKMWLQFAGKGGVFVAPFTFVAR
ncbi:MAG: hypothetical protein M3Y18_06005 [Candidatus Eremiobacteraeota bacterium]|nr:hypothetical protein [Candidatus Eremiobacteraeota bacterium]